MLYSSLSLFARELTIEEAISLGLKNSAEVKAAEADYNSQYNKQISSWLELGPRLNAKYNHAFFDSKLVVPFNNQDVLLRDDVIKKGSLTLTQPITGLFALAQKAIIDAKQKNAKASLFKQTKSQVAFRIAESYLRAQQSERMWEIEKARIESSLAQKKDGEALYRAERIHKGDFLKLELSLSQAQSAEAKARAQKEIAFYSLKELIGLNEPLSLSLVALIAPQEAQKYPSLDEAIHRALNNRQDLKQAKLGKEMAKAGKFAAFAQIIPNISFVAQIEHNFGKPSFSGGGTNKMLGLNLDWEFFNSGSSFFQLREAAFNATKVLYQVDALKQAIRIEVMQILASLTAAQEGLGFAFKAVEQAKEAYRIEKLQFASGKSSATALVLAQTAKILAEGNAVSLLSDLKIQKLKLQQALGEEQPVL